MATTASKATVSGIGAILSIGAITGSTGTETFTPLGEIMDYKHSGVKRGTVMTTNFNSGGVASKLGTILDWGQITLTVNRVSSDAGYTAVRAALVQGGIYDFQFQFPEENGQTTKGDLQTFSAIVTGFDLDVALEKQDQVNITLDITGVVSETVGS